MSDLAKSVAREQAVLRKMTELGCRLVEGDSVYGDIWWQDYCDVHTSGNGQQTNAHLTAWTKFGCPVAVAAVALEEWATDIDRKGEL